MFLLGNEFTVDEKRSNFNYYEPLTTTDSSLSPPVHSTLAAEIGDYERAMQHFELTALTDLGDVFTNSRHGVHVAAAAGTWMALVYGFAGLRDFDGEFTLSPRLPDRWSRLRFALRIRRCSVVVELTADTITLELRSGERLDLTVNEETVTVAFGAPVTLNLRQGDD